MGRTPSFQKKLQRKKIEISGIVQGVGFRPFMHRLVERFGFTGSIRNTASGVEVEIWAKEEELLPAFLEALSKEAPPLARIDRIQCRSLPPEGEAPEGFQIEKSEASAERRTLVSPDICTCPDCLRELFDKRDRRYRFPFINCTNCGPRFTIVEDVPYDRASTTMAAFSMCEDCSEEYSDIRDRRYHAQPDCCFRCGPRLFYLDASGKEVPGDPILRCREDILQGKIVAVKGLGGIHLACLPREDIVLRLRERKGREEKPFALMCRDEATAEKLCFLREDERRWLKSEKRPIVLLKKREKNSLSHISENDRIGLMLPYTPVHFLLFETDLDLLVMTSANPGELPILHRNAEALEGLGNIAEGYLLHDREIRVRCDDSLLYAAGEEVPTRACFVRRSRGFVPEPLRVKHPEGVLRPMLALGAEQKASFALSKGEQVFPAGHIGDLKNLETLELYTESIKHFENLFSIRPERLICDLHPDYMSTGYGEERARKEGIPLLKVQHHFAHMASCMADNDLDGPCLGLIWDGTGLGTDGMSWGGELLYGDYTDFRRMGSLHPIALPGGDRAVKEIGRIGLSLLHGIGEAETLAIPEAEQIYRMLRGGYSCPLSSSIGRLFDGVSAILGIRKRISYEGQGAILLEACAAEGVGEHYPIDFYEAEGILRYDHRPMIRSLLRDEASREIRAAKFMNTLVQMAEEQLRFAKARTGCDRVVLSGGVMQNQYLLGALKKQLSQAGFQLYCHGRVSANDEGLSLGQLMIGQSKE